MCLCVRCMQVLPGLEHLILDEVKLHDPGELSESKHSSRCSRPRQQTRRQNVSEKMVFIAECEALTYVHPYPFRLPAYLTNSAPPPHTPSIPPPRPPVRLQNSTQLSPRNSTQLNHNDPAAPLSLLPSPHAAVSALLPALLPLRRLLTLSLSGCGISPRSIKKTAALLPKLTALTRLDLRCNHM